MMRKPFLHRDKGIQSSLFLFALSLLFACGGGENLEVLVSLDDINEQDFSGVQFGIFDFQQIEEDIDDDGTADLVFSKILILSSEEENLCEILTGGESFLELDDLLVISSELVVFESPAPGEEVQGIRSGDTFTSDSESNNEILVLSNVFLRKGGDFFIQANGPSTGTVNILEFDPEKTFSGDFQDVITVEFANEAAFNSDADGDGIDDFQSLNNELTISYQNLTPCSLL